MGDELIARITYPFKRALCIARGGHSFVDFHHFVDQWIRAGKVEHYSFNCAHCGKRIER